MKGARTSSSSTISSDHYAQSLLRPLAFQCLLWNCTQFTVAKIVRCTLANHTSHGYIWTIALDARFCNTIQNPTFIKHTLCVPSGWRTYWTCILIEIGSSERKNSTHDRQLGRNSWIAQRNRKSHVVVVKIQSLNKQADVIQENKNVHSGTLKWLALRNAFICDSKIGHDAHPWDHFFPFSTMGLQILMASLYCG